MLNLLVIRSTNPAQLTTFYQLFLPPFNYHQHGSGPMHYSVELDQLVFEIYPLLKNQKQADYSTRLGFQVKDLDHVINRVVKAGQQVHTQPKQSEWGYRAVVQDPDGRKVELLEG
ncbi:MAG: VOC family protein [Bacteroidota bacterium]